MESRGLLFELLLSAILAELDSICSFNHPSMQQSSCLTHQLVELQVLRQVASGEYQAAVMNALGCGLPRGAPRSLLPSGLRPTSPVGAEFNVCSKIIVAVPRLDLPGSGPARPCMDMHRSEQIACWQGCHAYVLGCGLW